MFAAYHKLAHLTAIVDYNKQQLDDFTAKILDLEPWSRSGLRSVGMRSRSMAMISIR